MQPKRDQPVQDNTLRKTREKRQLDVPGPISLWQLAIAAAMKGYRCVFTMPDKMSQEKVRLLKAFGAEVIVTPSAVPPDHPDNYVEMAKRIARERPGAVLANQFDNQANPVWQHFVTFNCPYDPVTQQLADLRFELWDHNTVKKDKQVG